MFFTAKNVLPVNSCLRILQQPSPYKKKFKNQNPKNAVFYKRSEIIFKSTSEQLTRKNNNLNNIMNVRQIIEK